MARAKGLPMKRSNKKSSWGGKRPGAGRKPKLEISDREQIAKDYFARMRRDEESRPARRKSVISELMDEFGITHRMVERAIAEFLPEIRSDTSDVGVRNGRDERDTSAPGAKNREAKARRVCRQ